MHIGVQCKIIKIRLFTKKNLSDNIKISYINDKKYHCELLCYLIFHLRCSIFLFSYDIFLVKYCAFRLFGNICAFYSNSWHLIYNSRPLKRKIPSPQYYSMREFGGRCCESGDNLANKGITPSKVQSANLFSNSDLRIETR